ncbi:Eukaryotic translation initiation factor 2-alpha kinase 3 [Acipenser ruthenus]|uniref:Eukaryotic translation initiation factor 2-alpha kinase 3 n=1 Tax=Acipenser ruthenus TaxID=7906 RepID=A0A662YU90_ACIRT|nr:Eukaryotic translation initiation factor 2-alpha kinase 3 [Acipenser ruthenus]
MDKKKSLGKENRTSLKSPVVSKSSKKNRLLVGSGPSSPVVSACTATPRQLSSTPLSSTRAVPENILISQAVKIQLIDFGLVKNLSEENLTPDVGTVEYMAPEQKGNVYTHKVDIFAMGLIVFEIFYPMTTVAEKVDVFSDLKGGVFPNGFKGEFPDIARLIGWMLSENPSHRPEAEKIAQAITKLYNGVTLMEIN